MIGALTAKLQQCKSYRWMTRREGNIFLGVSRRAGTEIAVQ
jgi:hypothetical protein